MLQEMYNLIKKEKVICTIQISEHLDISLNKVMQLITIMKDQNLLQTKIKPIGTMCSMSSCINNSKCGVDNVTELVDLLVLPQ